MSGKKSDVSVPPMRRCAIYTRVSTDHGLDQSFTSLDAQREACSAYIVSQKHEGWEGASARYADGGFSGGTIDRPAMKRLLSDVSAGKVDIVVVYKVDRLTRSLTDFARLVELFDKQNVSFVSITQAFNTTSSMGRLTLNVLLSFAQFEREVAGERIRDKIAASKSRGLRMGGPVPLGYDLINKQLMPNEVEAEHVRTMFRLYLQRQSLGAVTEELRAVGILTKVSNLKDGRTRGGEFHRKSGLHYILRNRVYLGELAHKGKFVAGAHPAIVDIATFDAVQKNLVERSAKQVTSSNKRIEVNASFILTSKLFDANGNRMTPSTTRKNGATYRYYISAPLSQGHKARTCSGMRVSAPAIERVVSDGLRVILEVERKNTRGGARWPASWETGLNSVEPALVALEKVVIRSNSLEIHFRSDDQPANPAVIMVPWSNASAKRPSSSEQRRSLRSETRARLVEGIAKARGWMNELGSGAATGLKEIADREFCTESEIRRVLKLAYLAPDIVRAALDGSLPEGCGAAKFNDMPLGWAEQKTRTAVSKRH